MSSSVVQFAVSWHDGGWFAGGPDPAFPRGVDVNAAGERQPACKVDLPYPAKSCGAHRVECLDCGATAAVGAAGRADDPRSILIACQAKPR